MSDHSKPGGAAGEEHELVTCVLGGVEFGLDINAVQEIVRLPKITPVPRAPAYVEGVANLRGNVLPIVNSRARFGLPSGAGGDNRVVVVELNGHPTGMIVDAVREVMRVSAKDVEHAPAAVQSIDGRFLKGVVKLNNGQRLVLLLDHDAILDVTAQAAAAAGETVGSADERAADGPTAEEHEHLVTFRLGEEEYGIPIMDIQEIIRVPKISAVPNSPPGVVGVTSLRSPILPVLDLRTKFGLGPRPADARREDERCLVVNVGGTPLALRVDAVNQVLQAPKRTVEPTPAIVAGDGPGGDQLRGIAKLDDGKRLIMLLAVDKLVSRTELKTMSDLTDRPAQGADRSRAEGAAEQDERQLVTFKVADEEFAVDIMQVQEIIRLEKVTKVPHVPDFVEGVVNLRGNVLPVIDLRKRVHLASKAYSDATRVVVVDLKGVKTGIIVDAVSEVMRVHTRHIEPAPAIVRSRYGDDVIEGVGKLNNGDRMFLLLRAEELLGTAKA